MVRSSSPPARGTAGQGHKRASGLRSERRAEARPNLCLRQRPIVRRSIIFRVPVPSLGEILVMRQRKACGLFFAIEAIPIKTRACSAPIESGDSHETKDGRVYRH